MLKTPVRLFCWDGVGQKVDSLKVKKKKKKHFILPLAHFFLIFILWETCTKEAAKPFHPLYSRNWTIYSHTQRHCAFFFFFFYHTFIYLKQPAMTSVCLRGTIENKIAVFIIKCVCFGVWFGFGFLMFAAVF